MQHKQAKEKKREKLTSYPVVPHQNSATGKMWLACRNCPTPKCALVPDGLAHDGRQPSVARASIAALH
ncbi:hypothetical protein VTN96DRAFT_1052 [Rasamsonia emersonii]